jgi:chemotaxis protein methyltransferase CheR
MTAATRAAAPPAPAGGMPQITDAEFMRLRDWLEATTGIHLNAGKRTLVTSRLARRLNENGVGTFTDYLKLVAASATERQMAVDLLTTNETYFFREPRHFDFLQRLLPQLPAAQPVRVWSAACSTGEEPYSIAMLLDSQLRGRPWEIVATDISSRVLEAARAGHYRMERARGIPRELLSRYCLKGTGRHEGTLLVSRSLRERVRFEHANLNAPLPDFGEFDVIFLRNVMIYFDTETKRDVVARLIAHLRPGGHFLVGHSETLNDVSRSLQSIAPSIYRAS